MPTISVIVPAYNAEDYLAQTIESVLAQTFADWELIVVDDGSTDRTGEIGRRYALLDKRVRVIWQENGNQARARNHGYRVASDDTRYFLFLDSDDVLEPFALQVLLDAYSKDPNAKAVFGQADYIDREGNRTPIDKHPASRHGRWTVVDSRPTVTSWKNMDGMPPTLHSLVYGCAITTPGVVLISRSSIEETGFFDPEIPGVEDWDYWIRLSITGAIGFTEKKVLLYRYHPQGVSRNRDLMRRRELLMRYKLLQSSRLSARQREQAIEAFRFHHVRLPVVAEARAFLERFLGEGNDPLASSTALSEPGSMEALKRDILVLAELDCDVGLAQELLQSYASASRAVTHSQTQQVRNAADRLAVEEKRLRQREDLSRLSKQWPFLPFRKAFRLSRHVYRVLRERGQIPWDRF